MVPVSSPVCTVKAAPVENIVVSAGVVAIRAKKKATGPEVSELGMARIADP